MSLERVLICLFLAVTPHSFTLAADEDLSDLAGPTEAAPETSVAPSMPIARGPAGAQSIDEIIVSAQKRDQRLMDVPIAITSVSGALIEEMGADDLIDISYVVPGLSVIENAPGRQQFQIRGISSFAGNPTVGYYMDEVVLTTQRFLQIDAPVRDIARIEVLRGPQGTLYGEGSMGGTIRIITNDPDFEGSTVTAGAEGYRTDGGDDSYIIHSVANLPLIQDKFAIRAVANYKNLGGWIEKPYLKKQNANHSKNFAGRVKALFTPSDRLTLKGLVNYQNIDVGMLNNSDDENMVDTTPGPTNSDDEIKIFNLTGSYDFDFAELLTTSSWFSRKGHANTEVIKDADGAFNPVEQQRFVTSLPASSDPRDENFIQEIRMVSSIDSRFQWSLGIYYTDLESEVYVRSEAYTPVDDVTSVLGLGPISPEGTVADLLILRTSDIYAGFGEVSYAPWNWMMATIGFRHFVEKSRHQVWGDTLMVNSSSDQRATFRSNTPRFNLSFRPEDNWLPFFESTMFYITVAKGFRSGGFNVQVTTGQVPATFDPENLWSYEAGAKIIALQGLLTLEVAGFHNEWSNLQLVTITDGSVFTEYRNGGSAFSTGFEWSLSVKPFEQLLLSTTGTVLNAQFRESSEEKQAGDPIDFVPELTWSVSAVYSFNLWGETGGMIRVDFQHQDETYNINRSNVDSQRESDKLDFLNARIGIENPRWSAYIFGRNLLNEDGALDISSLSFQARPRPINYGLELKAQIF